MSTLTRNLLLLITGISLTTLTVCSQPRLAFANDPGLVEEPAALTPTDQPPRPTDRPEPTDEPPTPPPPRETPDDPEPTDEPEPTDQPEPTDEPEPTDQPEPTDEPEPTGQPTNRPQPTTPPDDDDDDDDDDGAGVGLEISKQIQSSSVAVGDEIEFVITVAHSDGDREANNVVIEDTLPGFLSLVDATTSWGQLDTSGNSVIVRIATLFPGDTVTVRITARVTSLAQPPDNRNTATVSSDAEEDDLSNNRATVSIPFPEELLQTTTVQPTGTGTILPTTTITATATISPLLTATVSPTGTPLATPTIAPVALPNTGEANNDPAVPILPAALGFAGIALGSGLLLRLRHKK